MNVSLFLVIYFIFIKQNVASDVLPVENLTLACHNLQTVAYWNHSQSELQPRFTVTLQSYYEGTRTQVCTDTPAYYCNVSAATQGIIRDDYIIFVSVSGQNASEPASDITFSYDRTSSSNHICSVDLPPVTVSVQPDRHIKTHFLHPFHVYKKAIKQSNWKKFQIFNYIVITKDQKEHGFSCHSKHQACEARLPAEVEADKHCVNIRGVMDALTVTTPHLICIDEPPPATDTSMIIIYITLSVIIILAVCCGLYIVFRKLTKLPLPESITKMLKGVNGHLLIVEEPNISPVCEDPSSRSSNCCSPLLFVETPTDNLHPPPQPDLHPPPQPDLHPPPQPDLHPPPQPDLHPPPQPDLHPAHSDPGSSAQQTHFPIPICRPNPRLMDQDVTALPCDELSLQGGLVEEVEEAHVENIEDLQACSGYERRNNILLEIDAGDMVEGYM